MFIEIFYILGSYLLGSVLGGYVLAKILKKKNFAKKDLPGAGGTSRQFGLSAGILVGFFDALKGVAVVFVGQALGLDLSTIIFGSLATVVGHNWPVFLKFKGGGGGLATSIGITAMLIPRELVISMLIAIVSGFLYKKFLKKKMKRATVPIGASMGLLFLLLLSWHFNEPKELIFLALGLGFLALMKIIEWKIKPIRPKNEQKY